VKIGGKKLASTIHEELQAFQQHSERKWQEETADILGQLLS